MAFLTYSEIRGNLKEGDENIVTLLLAGVEQDLFSLGLSFDTENTATARQFYGDRGYTKHIFDVGHCREIASIVIKNNESSYFQTLTASDYTLSQNRQTLSYNSITLSQSRRNALQYPDYLEITAKWSLPVSDWSTSPYNILKLVIAEYIKARLDLINSDNKDIVSSSNADSSVTYKMSQLSQLTGSILDFPLFKSVIQRYL